ncbi:LOG family protein [Dactylosporangium salmoneum]|uniref:Rossmann fold nucleotide-binding protein n=1 Tax=Dactylosporangium salmoneum TaxID=53361 RepID=A0ABP5SVY8_9ACTN
MADDGTLAESLAAQVRQSLHGCAQHPGGPLAAFDRCCEALADGRLTPREFRDVGARLVAMSEARLAGGAGDRALAQRETRLIRFVSALFGLPGAPGRPVAPALPRTKVAVVGKGRNCPEPVYELALAAGELVGSRPDRCLLLTGGLAGVMRAAATGAKRAGGLVVSVLPAQALRPTAAHDQADLTLDTGMSVHVRNVVLASSAGALIALPGGHGTLQEIIVATDLGKPVWALGDHAVRLPGVEYLDSLTELAQRLDAFLDAPPGDAPPESAQS